MTCWLCFFITAWNPCLGWTWIWYEHHICWYFKNVILQYVINTLFSLSYINIAWTLCPKYAMKVVENLEFESFCLLLEAANAYAILVYAKTESIKTKWAIISRGLVDLGFCYGNWLEFIICCSDWSSWTHIWNVDTVDLHPLLYLCIQPW